MKVNGSPTQNLFAGLPQLQQQQVGQQSQGAQFGRAAAIDGGSENPFGVGFPTHHNPDRPARPEHAGSRLDLSV